MSPVSFIFDPPAPALVDLAPDEGTTLATSSTPITFTLEDVADATVFIFLESSGSLEIVYDSSNGFSANYSASSSYTPIGNDAAVSVVRTSGWPTDPTLRVVAIDGDGNTLDEEHSWLFTPAAIPIPTTAPAFQYESELALTTTDFGSDILVFPDLDRTLSLNKTQRVLAEAIAKRWLTERGSLVFHPGYGFDIRSYLNAPITTARLDECRTLAEREAEQDERVESATVRVTFDPETKTLAAKASIVAAEGPFQFTLAVTKLTMSLLSEG